MQGLGSIPKTEKWEGGRENRRGRETETGTSNMGGKEGRREGKERRKEKVGKKGRQTMEGGKEERVVTPREERRISHFDPRQGDYDHLNSLPFWPAILQQG